MTDSKRHAVAPIPASAAEQEALFQALLARIPSIDDPVRLDEATEMALALMLRRPSDRGLRDDLIRHVRSTIAGLGRGGAAPNAGEMRVAVRDCLRVLRVARSRRLSRGTETALAAHSVPPPHGLFSSARTRRSRHVRVGYAIAVAGVMTVMVGALLWLVALRPAASPRQADPARLVEQMVAALHGEVPPVHVFGGPLRRDVRGDLPVIVAEAVPPRACAAAGWALVRKGLLTINGVTPSRASAARITDLCNQGDGSAAVIQWMPK